jgi:uncharacterized protein (TIGR02246 family)
MMLPSPLADMRQPDDADVVARAQAGNRDALEELVARHQAWIYNIALRMVYLPQDAEDITQEILIKVITKLSTFESRSSFRTWLYRIVVNHVLNMKRTRGEEVEWTFDRYGSSLRSAPDMELPDPHLVPADVRLLVEEAKIGCTTGMLLCLTREQRLAYILGEIFGVTDTIGAELLEISRDNFRQKVARARRDLHQFMHGQCGLINEANPCRCAKKTQAFMKAGYLDPANLLFAQRHVTRVRDVAPKVHEDIDALDFAYANIHRDHPFQTAPDFVASLRKLVNGPNFKSILQGFAILAVCSVTSACARVPDNLSRETIIALEKGALDRWGKGDPQGFFDIMSSDQTYFDPMTEKRIDGQEALKEYIVPFRGKISIERVEMVDPKVQRVGDLAVLTFNLNDYGAQVAGGPKTTARWNSTEVYQRINGSWKIVHSHWSYVKPDVVPSMDAREADARAIREAESDWGRAWAAKDLERIMSHYADDASVELAGVPIMSGKDAIRAGVQHAIADRNFALSFAPSQIEISKGGDLAYVRGAYTVTVTDVATKRPVTVKGKYVIVYRKQVDGHWKAIHDINNRDS